MMKKSAIKSKITLAFKRFMNSNVKNDIDKIPHALNEGKLYEAFALGEVARNIRIHEGYKLRLTPGNTLRLKSSPGKIDASKSHVLVFDSQYHLIAKIWTDIEFVTISYELRQVAQKPAFGDFHELDIVVLDPNISSGRPTYKDIYLGVECKAMEYDKSLLRQILGVRREMAFYHGHGLPNILFKNWPGGATNSRPSSHLIVYSNSSRVTNYSTPGQIFGINFYYLNW